MSAEELEAAIHEKREYLKVLSLRQETDFTDEREGRIVAINIEVHDLKAQLFRTVQVENEGQPA